jgi:cell division septation protein DedD
MTRMAGPGNDRDYDDDPPRGIFSALWFRALLVIVVLGVIAAVAVPYVLDIVNPPAKTTAKAPSPPQVPQPSPPPVASPPLQSPAPPPVAAPSSPPAPAELPRAEPPRPEPPAVESSRAIEPPKPAEPPARVPPSRSAPRTPPATATAPAVPPAARGTYWVQVGAFKDPETARKVADQLREQKYKVAESPKASTTLAAPSAPGAAPPPSSAGDRYEVFVSGTSAADMTQKLSGKGVTAEGVAGGVVLKPSLPLRDAVALSRELTADGLRVQVRRAGPPAVAAPAPASPVPAVSGSAMLHRVRVGSFPDRSSAQAVVRELEGKGYKPFIARGD